MRTYTLPDGRTIKAGAERFMAPEAMFNPRLIDKECDGLSDTIFSCIQVNTMLLSDRDGERCMDVIAYIWECSALPSQLPGLSL